MDVTFVSPDKCTVISLRTKYAGMTIHWKTESEKVMEEVGRWVGAVNSQIG